MKIALITVHNIDNYGSALQTFATKKILSQYGEVETINYFNPNLFPNHLELIRFGLSIRGIRLAMRDILLFKDRNQIVRKFKKFLKSNMNLSKLVTQHDIQNGVINNFDVYVCGSDQIWNSCIVSKCGKLDPIYFLSFANKKAKKISYASSMGGYRFTDSENAKVKDLLKDFKAISVRESDTQQLLSQLLKREVFHVLDPVLLLSDEEWLNSLSIDKSCRSIKEDYILVYGVIREPLQQKVVDFFAKKLGIKVVTIDQAFNPLINADVQIKDAGPLDFIELFANAQFVVSQSFHGTCFSVIFKKPFVSVCSKGRKVNRIESLLNLLGLENRFVDDEKNLHKLSTDFSYELAEKKLEEERAKSIIFLKSNIEKVNG